MAEWEVMIKWYEKNKSALNLLSSVIFVTLCAYQWFIGKPALWIDFAFVSSWLIISEIRELLRGKE